MKLLTVLLLSLLSLEVRAVNLTTALGIATRAANEHGIDPKLAAAIMHVESSGNPKAVGKLGEVGLFQLRPEFHKCASFDAKTNARCAMKYLAQLKKRKGKKYPNSWWVFYNAGPNRKGVKPKETAYYHKVSKRLNGGALYAAK